MASWNPATGTGGGGATQQLVLSNTTLSLVPGGGSVVLPTGVVSSVNTLLVSSLIVNQEILLPSQVNPLIRILSTGQIIAQRVDAPIIGGTLGTFSEVDVSMINATSGSITDLYVDNLTGQNVQGYQVKGNYFNADDRTLIIPNRSWYNPIDGHVEITTNVEYGSNGAGVPLVMGVPAYAMSTLYANEFITPDATISQLGVSTITMDGNGSNITTSGSNLTYGGQVITTGNQGNAANWAQYPANSGYVNFNNGSLNNINGISAQAGNMSILENYQNEQRSVTVGRFNNTFNSYQPNVAIGSRNTTIAAGVDQLQNASAGYLGEGSKINMDAYPGVIQSLFPGYNADSQINLTAHGGYDYSIPNPFPPPTTLGVSGGRGQINLTAYNSYYFGVVPNPLNRGQIRLNAALVSVGNDNTLPFGETQNVDIQGALVQVIAGSVGLPNPFGVTGTIFRSRNGVGIRNIDPTQNLDSRLFVRELWGMAISPGDLDIGDRSLFIQAQGSQGVQMSNASFIHGQDQYGNPGLVITNLTTATGSYPASVQAQITALQNQITNISTTGGVSSLTLWSLYPAISTLQTQRDIAMFGSNPSISTTNGVTLTDFSGGYSYLNTGVLALGRYGTRNPTKIALAVGSDDQTMGVYTVADAHYANLALSTIKFDGTTTLNVSSGSLLLNGTNVGFSGKATSDLNMAGYNITSPSTLTVAAQNLTLQATDTTSISTVSMSIQATGDINIAASTIALSNVSSINGQPYTIGGNTWVGTATSDLDMQSYKISGCNAGNMLGNFQPFKFVYEPPTAAGQSAEFAIQAHPQDAGVVYDLRYGVDMAAGTAYLRCEWPGYIVVPITITGQNVTMDAGENAYVNSGGYVNINSVYGIQAAQSNTGGSGLLSINSASNLFWNGTQLDGGGGGGWIGTAQSDLNMNGYNIVSQSNLNISTGTQQINLNGNVFINGAPFAPPSSVYISTSISPNLNVSSITFNGGNRIISSLINFSTAELRISSINGLQPGPANWAAYPVYPNTAISFGPESVWIKGTGNGIFTDLTGNNSIPITAQSFVAFNPAVNNGLGRFTIDQDGTPAILGGASQLNNLRVSTLYISTNVIQADSQNIYVNGVNPVTNWWEYNTAYSTLTVALSADGVNPITTGSSFPANGSYITIENLNGFQTTSMNLSDSLGNTYPNPSPLPGPYESYTFQLTNTIPSGGDLALVVYTSQGPWYCQITNNSGTATVGFTGDRNAYTVGTPASASGKALTINTQGTTYPTAISIINDTTQGTDLVVASNVTQSNRPLRMWATNAGILNIDNNGATGISLNQNTLTTTNLQATLVSAPTVTARIMNNKSTLTSNIVFPDIEGFNNVLYGNRFGLYYQGTMLATASNTSNWSHFPANSNIDLNSNSIIGINSNTSNSPASFYALDMSNLANYISGTPQGTTKYGIRISNSNQVGSNNFAPQVTLFTDNVVGGGGITSVDTSYGGSYPQPFALNVGSLTCSASNFNFPSFTTGAFGQTTLTPNSLTTPNISATYAGFSTLTVSSLVVSIPGTYAYTGLAGFQIAPYFWSVDGGAYPISTIAIRPADAAPSVAWGPVTIDSGVTSFGTGTVTVNISGSVSNAFPSVNVVPQSRWGVLTGVLSYGGISGSIAQLTRIGLGNLSDTGGNCVFQVMTGIPSSSYGGPIGISLTVDFNTFNLRSDSVTVKFGTTYPGTYTLTNVGIRWLGPGGWTG